MIREDRIDFVVIDFVVVPLLLMLLLIPCGLIVIEPNMELDRIEYVACYDENYNEIVGLTCEEEIYSLWGLSRYQWQLLIISVTIILFLFGIISIRKDWKIKIKKWR